MPCLITEVTRSAIERLREQSQTTEGKTETERHKLNI